MSGSTARGEVFIGFPIDRSDIIDSRTVRHSCKDGHDRQDPGHRFCPQDGYPFEKVEELKPTKRYKALALHCKSVPVTDFDKLFEGEGPVIVAFVKGARKLFVGDYLTVTGRMRPLHTASWDDIRRVWSNVKGMQKVMGKEDTEISLHAVSYGGEE